MRDSRRCDDDDSERSNTDDDDDDDDDGDGDGDGDDASILDETDNDDVLGIKEE